MTETDEILVAVEYAKVRLALLEQAILRHDSEENLLRRLAEIMQGLKELRTGARHE